MRYEVSYCCGCLQDTISNAEGGFHCGEGEVRLGERLKGVVWCLKKMNDQGEQESRSNKE